MAKWLQLQKDIADTVAFHLDDQIACGVDRSDAIRESAMAALCAVTVNVLAILGKECETWTQQHDELIQGFISDLREMPDRKDS